MHALKLSLVGLMTGCIGTVALAQSPQISVGAELLVPVGDLAESASLGYGPAIGFEYPTSPRSSVTLQLAYDFLSPKDDDGDVVDSWTYMPIQLGGKWYFAEEQAGFYGALQAGMHNVVYKTNEIDLGPVLGTIPAQSETEAYFSRASALVTSCRRSTSGCATMRWSTISPTAATSASAWPICSTWADSPRTFGPSNSLDRHATKALPCRTAAGQ